MAGILEKLTEKHYIRLKMLVLWIIIPTGAILAFAGVSPALGWFLLCTFFISSMVICANIGVKYGQRAGHRAKFDEPKKPIKSEKDATTGLNFEKMSLEKIYCELNPSSLFASEVQARGVAVFHPFTEGDLMNEDVVQVIAAYATEERDIIKKNPNVLEQKILGQMAEILQTLGCEPEVVFDALAPSTNASE